MTVYVQGRGPALLLVHSINAAASAAEMRPLHERAAATHTVFTPDLPGYGLSDRSDRAYSPRLFTDALHQVMAAMHRRCGPAPVPAVGLSLGCEFLARAAVEQPQRWRSLALVSPTGFGEALRRGTPGSTLDMPWLRHLLVGPGWGGAAFRLLTRPAVIDYFLRRAWGAPETDEALWRYNVFTARQPGAEHAPLEFLSGGLFSADALSVYEQLSQPVWMSHGMRGDFTDYGAKRQVEARPNWRFTVFSTGALPYFEVPQQFCARYDGFLARGR
jgi:pimeloyl-ACP methyl ester carboxylesterase